MRLVFIRRRWSPTGGAEHYLNRLARQLSQRGHTTTLLCESWQECRDHPFDSITTLPSSRPSPQTFARACNAHLAHLDTDCVFSMERGIRADVYRAGDGLHRCWLERRRRFQPFTGWIKNLVNPKNAALCSLEKFTFNPVNTGQIIVNSLMVQEEIDIHFQFPKTRMHLIPNGVDFKRFSSGNRAHGRKALGVREDEFLILLVGSGAVRKGHRYFYRALNGCAFPTRGIIIDSPPPCPMEDAYAAADLFLLPTLYDPFANVTLEAMAAGLPVITTRANGACMAIEDGVNGFLVNGADHISHTKALLNALRDEKLRASVGLQARETAQLYSLERNVEATLELCEKIRRSKEQGAN